MRANLVDSDEFARLRAPA